MEEAWDLGVDVMKFVTKSWQSLKDFLKQLEIEPDVGAGWKQKTKDGISLAGGRPNKAKRSLRPKECLAAPRYQTSTTILF